MAYNTGQPQIQRLFTPEELETQRGEKLKEFQDKLLVIQKEITSYETQLKNTQDVSAAATAELDSLRRQVEEQKQALIVLTDTAKRKANDVDALAQDTLAAIEKKRQEIFADLEERKKGLDVRQLAIEKLEEAQKLDIEDLSNKNIAITAAIKAAEDKTAELRNREELLKSREESLRISCESLEKQRTEIKSLQDALSSDILNHEKEIAQYRLDISALKAAQKELADNNSALALAQEQVKREAEANAETSRNLLVSRQSQEDMKNSLTLQKQGLDRRDQDLKQREQILRDSTASAVK